MTVFAIMSTSLKLELEAAVNEFYPDTKSYRVSDMTWFVTDKGTTAKEISEKLGIKKDGIRGVVIIPVRSSYYGVASSTLWEWLKAAIEESSDG